MQEVVEEVDPASLENLPIGLDGSAYRWTDLHGEGIPGILTEQAGAWFYKRNLSPIPASCRTVASREGEFAPLETVALKPNVALGAGAEFMDLAGDGQPDVVVLEGPTPGLYEHDDAEGWQPFRPFTSRLNRDLRDPNLKFVDLDGDGHADVLITEDDAFVWHASLAEEGFGPARRVAQALDEEKGPRIVFADGTQSIYLADLSGDGLTDIVRIRNGEVCYWPNLGYGRFGAKVTMDNAPWFDNPDQFDHKRIRLADIDGSGTTDIIYLHRDGVRLYFNQSGNSWSQPQLLKVFPRIDDLVSIVPTDLLGNGTACLVWSSPLPGDARRPMRYVNLMGGQKPHLLVKTDQQPRRRNPRRLRALDQVLPAGQARRQALDHAAAVPGARGRARRDLRPHQPQPLRHPLRLPPRLLRRRGARVPRLRHGRAVGHGTVRGPGRRRRPGRQHRRRIARAAGAHQDLVPHRRLPRPRSRLRLLCRPAQCHRPGRVLPRAAA